MLANIKEWTFEDQSALRRIEAKCFCQCHLKIMFILPLVGKHGECCSYDANIGMLRVDSAVELR
jgi:hypothetical protein